ncbi:MAG TPA: cupin domain-containing protein [Miltoncostaeaceae bacterium]|nr:cupin domain-containing protein [Miltoncostaeaceae bacterium]
MHATGTVIHAGPVGIRFLVEPEESGGSVSVLEGRVPPDVRTPAPHSHDGFEETIYGLEGVSTWTVDGRAHDVGPGEALCIRRGEVHAFSNHGDRDAVFLAIATPGLFGPSYFLEIGEVMAAAGGGPPDMAAIFDVMRRHGLTPAPPAA